MTASLPPPSLWLPSTYPASVLTVHIEGTENSRRRQRFTLMDVLVINRSVDSQRMAFQELQLNSLQLRYQRFDAVTPDTLSPPQNDPYWTRWNRRLTETEKAIFASHRLAWEAIADCSKPKLVVEDDACLSAEVPQFLKKASKLANVDRITLEFRGRKKLVATELDSRLSIRRLYQDRTGAAAYILWPNGARKLLFRSAQRPGLADGILCEAHDLITYQADPALAIQLDAYQRHIGPPPIETRSTKRSPVPTAIDQTSIFQEALYRFRRISAELYMGTRFLRYQKAAVRKHVNLSQNWPDLG